VVLTLRRITEANGTPGPRLGLGGPVSTAHGIGAELAVVASVVLIVCSDEVKAELSRGMASASMNADRTRVRRSGSDLGHPWSSSVVNRTLWNSGQPDPMASRGHPE
jgi:hypothetical protein